MRRRFGKEEGVDIGFLIEQGGEEQGEMQQNMFESYQTGSYEGCLALISSGINFS